MIKEFCDNCGKEMPIPHEYYEDSWQIVIHSVVKHGQKDDDCNEEGFCSIKCAKQGLTDLARKRREYLNS